MTEPLPSTQIPSESLAYQPISGWAIAGLAVGSLFTLLVVLCTIVALVQGAPMFFPIWIVAFAFVGGVLSVLGQQHVRNSEGTRTGAKLARIGLWLSLVSGLSYLSYYFVTGIALQSQANAFVMEIGDDSGFFPRLREGGDHPAQLNAAFLLTQPPNSRTGLADNDLSMRKYHDEPTKDGAPGPLTQFREGMFARILYKQLGKDAEITPLAVQDWRYEQRSYKILRTYRVKTKEVEVDLLLAVLSMEPEAAGQGRKWFVNLRESAPLSKTFTPLGEGVKRLRQHSIDWLNQKVNSLNEGASFAGIKDVDKTPWDLLQSDDAKKRQEYREAAYQAFAGDGKQRINQFNIITRAEDAGKWEQADGKIRMHLMFGFTLPAARGQQSAYKAEAVVVLESKKDIDPSQFPAGEPQPGWNIVRAAFTTMTPIGERKPGG
jgi:hypothetical protein